MTSEQNGITMTQDINSLKSLEKTDILNGWVIDKPVSFDFAIVEKKKLLSKSEMKNILCNTFGMKL